MHQLTLDVPEPLVEEVSDVLIDECQALSVSVEDADAGTPAERALFGEPGMPVAQAAWQHSRLLVLFADEAGADRASAWVLAQDAAAGLRLRASTPVPDEDWVRLTQSQFEPVEITPSFWIVPSWHEPPAQATRVIRLDPGLAFGTGTHPTTRMCLRWLARHDARHQDWSRVLDYGCGSGILAIGAALCGGSGIEAVDIDPAAVEATQANAAANGVTLAAVGLPDLARGRYPLVLANILATPLKLLAPVLAGFLAPGGQLVLAGILERQAGELTQAYAPWLELQVSDQEDGWILMTGCRPAAGAA